MASHSDDAALHLAQLVIGFVDTAEIWGLHGE
jgi:hypothetical protein